MYKNPSTLPADPVFEHPKLSEFITDTKNGCLPVLLHFFWKKKKKTKQPTTNYKTKLNFFYS